LFAPIEIVEYLQALPKLVHTDINYIEYGILKYICEHPESTSYEIEKLKFPRRGTLHRKRIRTIKRKKDLSKNVDSRSIRRYISDLCKKGFIKRVQKDNAKLCSLTSSGVYYLILRLRIMPGDVYKGVVKNYGNDKLFQLFVYPYIKQDTLLHLTDTPLTSRVSLFLHQCCREIEDILVKDKKKKYVMELVPGRQSVLWNENKTNSPRAVPVMSLEESAADSLFLNMPQYLPTFIFDLISKAKAGSPDFCILSKDERFMQTLKETKTNFDKQYEKIEQNK
jgi:hypothetical protein